MKTNNVMGWQIRMVKPSRIKRIIQPVGIGSREYRWSNGFLLRLPRGNALLVNRDPRLLGCRPKGGTT